jgi:hypothetical protein
MAALFRGGIDIAVNVPFTDDFPTAAAHLAAAGVTRCDHIEPLPDGFRGGWIASPASIVHMVREPDAW